METMELTPEFLARITASMEEQLLERYPDAIEPALDALQKDARKKHFSLAMRMPQRKSNKGILPV